MVYPSLPAALARGDNNSALPAQPALCAGLGLANEHFAYLDGSKHSGGETPDLSYWSGMCESYQPEWFPLGVRRIG